MMLAGREVAGTVKEAIAPDLDFLTRRMFFFTVSLEIKESPQASPLLVLTPPASLFKELPSPSHQSLRIEVRALCS